MDKPLVSANFDNSLSPGGGDFDNFFLENVKIPTVIAHERSKLRQFKHFQINKFLSDLEQMPWREC